MDLSSGDLAEHKDWFSNWIMGLLPAHRPNCKIWSNSSSNTFIPFQTQNHMGEGDLPYQSCTLQKPNFSVTCQALSPLSPTDFLQSLTNSLRSCPGPTRKNRDGEESEAARQEHVLPRPFNHCSGLLWKFLCTFSHGCILPHISPTPRILTSRLCRVPVGSWCQSQDQGRVV